MGIAIKLSFPDFCKDEHRLYHVVGRACAICVPDSYARYVLWNSDYMRWHPLAWMNKGSYWDDEQQCAFNEHGDKVLIPAICAGAQPFQGFGPGVKIVTEEIPDDVYERLMEAQKVGSAPGSFEKVWFEYEDSKELMDS